MWTLDHSMASLYSGGQWDLLVCINYYDAEGDQREA